MKTWQVLVLGILIGLAAAAGILIVASEPRGYPVRLAALVTPTKIVVYISGAVVNPGVYQLDPGTRVEQAVIAAGGLAPDADDSRANLARPLEDGDQVHIPGIDDPLSMPTGGGTANNLPALDLNTATVEDLERLPGIGTIKAQSIIAYRESHGTFLSIEELLRVPGIGASLLEQIKPYLYLSH